MPIRTVAIVGVGLIGGSFALALRKAGFEGRILGVSRPRTIGKALELGVIDAGLPLADALAEADLVYLAQPILRILDQLPEIARLARPGALVTDAGSTKRAIVEKAREVFRNDTTFLGGHPMAGKEGRGVEIAEAELFAGSLWVLTPLRPDDLEQPLARDFTSWIDRIGARRLTLDAAEHDRTVAYTSHLPQLLSTALACSVDGNIADNRLEVAGGGLRDMSRLAGSSYDIWEGILLTNAAPIDDALTDLIRRLESIRALLEDSALAEKFEAAQTLYKKVRRE